MTLLSTYSLTFRISRYRAILISYTVIFGFFLSKHHFDPQLSLTSAHVPKCISPPMITIGENMHLAYCLFTRGMLQKVGLKKGAYIKFEALNEPIKVSPQESQVTSVSSFTPKKCSCNNFCKYSLSLIERLLMTSSST